MCFLERKETKNKEDEPKGEEMKTKYFLILILAVLLLPGRISEKVTAASAGEDGVILEAAMDERSACVVYAGTGSDYGKIGIEEKGMYIEDGIYILAQGKTEEIQDRVIPLAELSSDMASGRFSWRGFLLGFLALVILGVGIWAVSKSKSEKANRK